MDETAAEPAARTVYVRARRTNNPLVPPASLRKNSTEARRWTDLCRSYGQRLGPKRLADEGTRAKLLSLIHLTLRLEQMRDAVPPLPLHSELHAVQELRALLAELDLNEPREAPPAPPAPQPAPPLDLKAHIASRVGDAS